MEWFHLQAVDSTAAKEYNEISDKPEVITIVKYWNFISSITDWIRTVYPVILNYWDLLELWKFHFWPIWGSREITNLADTENLLQQFDGQISIRPNTHWGDHVDAGFIVRWRSTLAKFLVPSIQAFLVQNFEQNPLREAREELSTEAEYLWQNDPTLKGLFNDAQLSNQINIRYSKLHHKKWTKPPTVFRRTFFAIIVKPESIDSLEKFSNDQFDKWIIPLVYFPTPAEIEQWFILFKLTDKLRKYIKKLKAKNEIPLKIKEQNGFLRVDLTETFMKWYALKDQLIAQQSQEKVMGELKEESPLAA